MDKISQHIATLKQNHDDVIKWKHFPRNWPFVRGIHRSPVNSPHKGQWRGALMFTLICARIYGWVNTREAGDFRRYRLHYDVIVMICIFWCVCAVNMHTHVNKSVIYRIIYVLFMLFRILYQQFKNTLQCVKHNDHTSCSTRHNHLLSLKGKTRTYVWIDWPRCRNFTYMMTHDLIYQPMSVSLHKAAQATKRWYKKRFSNS